jgi:hypothetical protein
MLEKVGTIAHLQRFLKLFERSMKTFIRKIKLSIFVILVNFGSEAVIWGKSDILLFVFGIM